jgi:NodT family efflux transporter outer membrane factor (OMF) lipoprotein
MLFLVFLLAVTGCSLHTSNIAESQLKIPQTYSHENENPAPPVGKWWERFEDEKLNSLIEEALKNNLDIAGAYERLNQSMALMRIAGASEWPVVNAEGSGGRVRQAGALGPVTEDTYRLSAAASYEIDLWQKNRSKTDAAHYDMLASEADLKALFISISAQAADLYYLAVEQRAQLELSDRTIASFQDTLERVERRYRGGLVPSLDVYQARQNLAAARSRRPLFESRLDVTLNALLVLTGRFPGKEIGGDSRELKDAPVFETGLPSQLIARRPDISAALLRLKASDKKIASAVADRFPSFDLTGSYGGTSDQLKNILDSPNIFWNILLQISQPVFEAGKRKAEVERTEAVFREDLAGYHKTVLNAFKEVEDSLSRINASKKRIARLNESVSASESALRIALDRYMQGLTDYLPVLTGQLSHFTAQGNLLEERRQILSSSIQLARALGGEWVEDIKER